MLASSMDNAIVVSVIGLGYVGLPVAVAFAQKFRVIAFDVNPFRITALSKNVDYNNEVSKDELIKITHNILYTDEPQHLSHATFHIIAVPSPINAANQPDFTHLIDASVTVGKYLKPNDIVVYESTVYPGATEEKCIPILEKISGLKSAKDFCVGYSPERINPGDKERNFANIKKVVSAQTQDALNTVTWMYSQVVHAGVHPVSSIKVAEAAKVIENTQRDINIALMNELAIIFNKLGIDTNEVLDAAGTKWNFIPFKPGLVGGHCIGVDPYYLTHKAIELGIHPEVILAGRRINDSMGKYIATHTIKELSRVGKKIKHSRVGILGITFKENISDIRNSRVHDIIEELKSYYVSILVHDPYADPEKVKNEYNIDLSSWDDLKDLDALILAVPHDEYKQKPHDEYSNKINNPKLIIDIKGILKNISLADENINLWRL